MPDDRLAQVDAGVLPVATVGSVCSTCGVLLDRKGVRTTTSQWLLGSGTELQILHNGDVYRLTLTKSGKLILHK